MGPGISEDAYRVAVHGDFLENLGFTPAILESARKTPGVVFVELVGPAGTNVIAHTFAGGRAPRRDASVS